MYFCTNDIFSVLPIFSCVALPPPPPPKAAPLVLGDRLRISFVRFSSRTEILKIYYEIAFLHAVRITVTKNPYYTLFTKHNVNTYFLIAEGCCNSNLKTFC